jgi:hypothetical protein
MEKTLEELYKDILFTLPEWKLKERRGTNKNIINLPKEKRYDPDGFFSLPKPPFELLALDLKKGSRIGYKVRSLKSHQFKDFENLRRFIDPHSLEVLRNKIYHEGGDPDSKGRDFIDSSIKILKENYLDNLRNIQQVIDKPLVLNYEPQLHNHNDYKTIIFLPEQVTSISHEFFLDYYAGLIGGSYELKTQFTMPDNRSIRFYLKCKHHDSKSIEIYFGVEDKNSLITFNRPARVDLEVKNAIYNNLEKLSEIVSDFPPSCNTESLSINARLLDKSLEDQIKYL